MHVQRRHFGGLDTRDHIELGRFDIRSMLRFEVEDKVIANPCDANIHLDDLCKIDVTLSEMVKSVRHRTYQSKIVKNY